MVVFFCDDVTGFFSSKIIKILTYKTTYILKFLMLKKKNKK